MKHEAVVIGGGVAGMTAALILAKRGMSVALVERDKRLAPVLRGFKRKGIQFDTGLHYTGGLGSDGPLLHYFKHLGVAEGLSLTPFPEEGFDEIHFGDTDRPFIQPYGQKRFKQTLINSFPGNELAIAAYFSEIEREWEYSSYLNLDRPFPDNHFSLEGDDRTLLEFLNSITEDQQLKAVLCAHTILSGVPPKRALLRTHVQVAGAYIHSVHGIKGGGLALVQQYTQQLEKAGVTILCGQAVEKLIVNSSGDFKGVSLTEGNDIQAKTCIFTAHPASLLDLAPDSNFRPNYQKRIRELSNCHSAFMLFGKLKQVPASLQEHNLLRFRSNDPNTMYPEPGQLAESPIFIGRAGHDGSVVAMISAPDHLHQEWTFPDESRTDEYTEYKSLKMLELLDVIAYKFPDVAENLEVIDFATPLTFSEYGCLPSGGIYGVEHAQGQYPVLPMTKIKGLYLAGQSVIAPGVMGAVISAYVACGITLGQETLRKEILTCN